MSIRHNIEKNIFEIITEKTKYVFQIVHNRFPVHLYYGEKESPVAEYKVKEFSFSPYYNEYGVSYLPATCMSEYVGFDSGDFRSHSLRVKNKNGDSCTVLEYKSHSIFKGRALLPDMPYSEADKDTETLEIVLWDKVTSVEVKIYYSVFSKEDVITRYVVIKNNGESEVNLEKCMSLMLDLPEHEYDLISLYGKPAFERKYQRNPLTYGRHSFGSRRGASSHQFNPFFALCENNCTQNAGNVYGFNFVYSGNFLNEIEVDQTGGTRIQIGLGDENFSWLLQKGEEFATPEALMTFSRDGIGAMSRNFHNFIRNHILPKEPFENRPVALNTWEACYFNIDQKEMLRFAKTASDCGIDLLVMDDGWFGTRNDDCSGLGDWFVNKEKFKYGLKLFVEKIKEYGIKFGIWIEPEMVNPDSELYRAHPEWCIQCKNREMMQSRNQLVLDFCNPLVIEYLKETFSNTFDGVPIDYFKWDMNRSMSQVGSLYLPLERQAETAHRYMLGVYSLMQWFKEKYPHAMIENCSGGGGRYDLGMMKYSTMIWTSDNTDPYDRILIQYSSLLAYPASVMSCHVADRELCEKPEQLNFRWHIAMMGALGYEFNLPNASDTVKNTVKKQVEVYRKYEDLILRGEYFSIISPFESNYIAYAYTDEERKHILLTFAQQNKETPVSVNIPLAFADENAVYTDILSGAEYSGRELKAGIKLMTSENECNSQILELVRVEL